LCWEGDEPSTTAAEGASAPPAEESAPIPEGETVAPAAEATLLEASMVEGEYVVDAQRSSRSSRSPREADPVFLLMIGAEVDGSTIPEAMPVVLEPEVAAGATSEPTEIAGGGSPGWPKKCAMTYCRVKPRSSRPLAKNSGCGADTFGADV
jgi:hypothetical protein